MNYPHLRIATAFTRQGSLVQSQPRPPSATWRDAVLVIAFVAVGFVALCNWLGAN